MFMKNITWKLIWVITILYSIIITYFFISWKFLASSSLNYLWPMFAYFIFTLPTSIIVSLLSWDSWNSILLIFTWIINIILLFYTLKLFKIIIFKIISIFKK